VWRLWERLPHQFKCTIGGLTAFVRFSSLKQTPFCADNPTPFQWRSIRECASSHWLGLAAV